MDNANQANIMQEMMKKMAAFRAECGDEINRAIPLYEDPTRYPIDELVALFHIQQRLMAAETSEQRAAIKAEFAAAREKIELLPNAPDRIMLWPEGNMPTQTE